MIGWWQLASATVSKQLERSRTLMHYIRAAILWVRESCWRFCRVQTKVVTHWWTIISEVTLIDQNTVYTCFDEGRRLLCCVHCDTCGSYPSQKIVQLGRNQDWFVIVFSGGVVYRQIRCDHFGHCLRMLYGSHLIIGLDLFIFLCSIVKMLHHSMSVYVKNP